MNYSKRIHSRFPGTKHFSLKLQSNRDAKAGCHSPRDRHEEQVIMISLNHYKTLHIIGSSEILILYVCFYKLNHHIEAW
jgi:hypothetical protein